MANRPLPPGAHGAGVPGTAASDRVKGFVRPKPVVLSEKFVADPRGGPGLVIGKAHAEVKDNRTKVTR